MKTIILSYDRYKKIIKFLTLIDFVDLIIIGTYANYFNNNPTAAADYFSEETLKDIFLSFPKDILKLKLTC